jgi:hypothetical protein
MRKETAVDCPMGTGKDTGVLLDYCAGRLDGGAAAGFERHLAQCAACRERAEAQRAVWTALDAWEPEPVSPEFSAALHARIEAERSRGWLPRLGFRPALSLALASMAFLAVLVIGPRHAPAPVPAAGQAVEPLDADRLERALDDVDMLRQMNPPEAL